MSSAEVAGANKETKDAAFSPQSGSPATQRASEPATPATQRASPSQWGDINRLIKIVLTVIIIINERRQRLNRDKLMFFFLMFLAYLTMLFPKQSISIIYLYFDNSYVFIIIIIQFSWHELFLSLSYIPAFVLFFDLFYKYPCSLFHCIVHVQYNTSIYYLHINNLQNIHMYVLYIHDPVDFTFLNIPILFTNTVSRSRFTLCISPLELIYISTQTSYS